MKTENEISKFVVEASIRIHKALGPGLLENAYKQCLLHELREMGLQCKAEQALPVTYKTQKIELGYRLDILVEHKVVIEIKSVDAINDIHVAQVLTYLKFGDFKLGLLLNFNEVKMVNGIRRVINRLDPEFQ
jgi:GxxExxY protein